MYLRAGPPRETLPEDTKTDTGPPYFLEPPSKLVWLVCSLQQPQSAVMLRFQNRLIVALAAGLHFRLDYRKNTDHAHFHFTGPGFDVPLVLPLVVPVYGTHDLCPHPSKQEGISDNMYIRIDSNYLPPFLYSY